MLHDLSESEWRDIHHAVTNEAQAAGEWDDPDARPWRELERKLAWLLGCTGAVDEFHVLQHPGESCPVHDPEIGG